MLKVRVSVLWPRFTAKGIRQCRRFERAQVIAVQPTLNRPQPYEADTLAYHARRTSCPGRESLVTSLLCLTAPVTPDSVLTLVRTYRPIMRNWQSPRGSQLPVCPSTAHNPERCVVISLPCDWSSIK